MVVRLDARLVAEQDHRGVRPRRRARRSRAAARGSGRVPGRRCGSSAGARRHSVRGATARPGTTATTGREPGASAALDGMLEQRQAVDHDQLLRAPVAPRGAGRQDHRADAIGHRHRAY